MMIKSVPLGIVDTAHVDDNIELVEDILLSSAYDDAVCKLACLQQHYSSKNFITVEGIRMCADDLLCRLGLNLIELFHFLGTHDNKIISDFALVLQVLSQVGNLRH